MLGFRVWGLGVQGLGQTLCAFAKNLSPTAFSAFACEMLIEKGLFFGRKIPEYELYTGQSIYYSAHGPGLAAEATRGFLQSERASSVRWSGHCYTSAAKCSRVRGSRTNSVLKLRHRQELFRLLTNPKHHTLNSAHGPSTAQSEA